MKDRKKNGASVSAGSPVQSSNPAAVTPAPLQVAELAEACVRFVERAVGVKLDYQPETLPLLDHYIDQAREVVKEKPEMLSIVAQASGAYFGEVVRRRYASWWRIESDDPSDWQIELENVFLAFSPVRQIVAALLRGVEQSGETGDEGLEGEVDMAQLTLEEEDRAAIYARLADLPPVTEREFCAPSTRLEVIDIAVEALRAKHLAEGEEIEARYSPEDYE